MFTKPLVQPSVKISKSTDDLASINRLLAAAAISKRFQTRLLTNPEHALKIGFGGEQFPLSHSTQEILLSIRASTLPEFVRKLDERLPHRLLVS